MCARVWCLARSIDISHQSLYISMLRMLTALNIVSFCLQRLAMVLYRVCVSFFLACAVAFINIIHNNGIIFRPTSTESQALKLHKECNDGCNCEFTHLSLCFGNCYC